MTPRQFLLHLLWLWVSVEIARGYETEIDS